MSSGEYFSVLVVLLEEHFHIIMDTNEAHTILKSLINYIRFARFVLFFVRIYNLLRRRTISV